MEFFPCGRFWTLTQLTRPRKWRRIWTYSTTVWRCTTRVTVGQRWRTTRASWARPSPNSSMPELNLFPQRPSFLKYSKYLYISNCFWLHIFMLFLVWFHRFIVIIYELIFSNSNLCFCFQAVFWRDVSLQLPDRNWECAQPKKPAERAFVSCKLITPKKKNIRCLINPR